MLTSHAGSMNLDRNPWDEEQEMSTLCFITKLMATRVLPAIIIVAMPFVYMMSSNATSMSLAVPTYESPLIHMSNYSHPKPFSRLDPVYDLHLYGFVRNDDTSPPPYIYRPFADVAVPTNEWYQNLLIAHYETTELQRVYAVPYMVDVAGPIPGLQIHPNHVDASSTVIQLSYVIPHGLTLGAAENSSHATSTNAMSNEYSVIGMTPLGITLKWVGIIMTNSFLIQSTEF